MAWIRNILDKNNVVWQTGELGKVDLGGGGTVAMYIANLGVDVVDLGVPVLSMHAPFEVVAKFDVYMTYLAVKALLKQNKIVCGSGNDVGAANLSGFPTEIYKYLI